MDTYEQARERPGTRDKQEKYFSGKKSNHTFKSLIIIMPYGRGIVDVVAGEPGHKSYITLFREYRSKFDYQQIFKRDKAYVGENLITTPIEKARKRELTTEQKEPNKAFSARRLFVEHRIKTVNTFLVFQKTFRLNFQKYELVMLTTFGRVMLRIALLILPLGKAVKASD
ncbi:transposase family protein [Microcoleus sp. Pol11C1]|uniref:transposase family protein n=1 Tax=unclassified Microcoleus TaxID=2642155 RepID=UPI002FD632E1